MSNVFKEAAKGYQQTVKHQRDVEVTTQQPASRKIVPIAPTPPEFADLPILSIRRVRRCPADFLVSFIWALPWNSLSRRWSR